MTAITSGETVETVADDVLSHVKHNLASRIDEVEGSKLDLPAGRVWVHTQEQIREWLQSAADEVELRDVIAAAIREHTTPRTVTTVEELDALPLGSVLMDAREIAWTRGPALEWRGTHGGRAHAISMFDNAPLTVLHEPEEATP